MFGKINDRSIFATDECQSMLVDRSIPLIYHEDCDLIGHYILPIFRMINPINRFSDHHRWVPLGRSMINRYFLLANTVDLLQPNQFHLRLDKIDSLFSILFFAPFPHIFLGCPLRTPLFPNRVTVRLGGIYSSAAARRDAESYEYRLGRVDDRYRSFSCRRGARQLKSEYRLIENGVRSMK